MPQFHRQSLPTSKNLLVLLHVYDNKMFVSACMSVRNITHCEVTTVGFKKSIPCKNIIVYGFCFCICRNTEEYFPNGWEWADGCGSLREDAAKQREADWKMPRKKQQNPQPVKCRYSEIFLMFKIGYTDEQHASKYLSCLYFNNVQ